MTGWKEEFLQTVLNDCTNLSGRIEDCHHFTIQDASAWGSCSMKQVPTVLKNELVAGKIGNSLPGGVKIHTGPEPANAATPNTQPHTNTLQAPSVGFTPGAAPSYANPIPGQAFHLNGESAAPVAAAAVVTPAPEPPVITPAPEPPVEVEDGYEVIRTEYVTEGNLVNMVIVKEKVEYVTETTTTYTSTETMANLKPRYVAHMHRHGRRHARH